MSTQVGSFGQPSSRRCPWTPTDSGPRACFGWLDRSAHPRCTRTRRSRVSTWSASSTKPTPSRFVANSGRAPRHRDRVDIAGLATGLSRSIEKHRYERPGSRCTSYGSDATVRRTKPSAPGRAGGLGMSRHRYPSRDCRLGHSSPGELRQPCRSFRAWISRVGSRCIAQAGDRNPLRALKSGLVLNG